MADTSKIAKNLERFAQAVAAHDRENPTHTTWGIGMSPFDIERLGLDEGETILPGIVIQADNGVTGNFRILCDGDHEDDLEEAEEAAVDLVSVQPIGTPAQGGDDETLPLRPVEPGRWSTSHQHPRVQ